MNKLTKGSLVTGAGLVLLLGGTGTFMTWNGDADVGGNDQVVAGHLDITGVSDGTWSSNLQSGAVDVTSHQIVPGETLTYSATMSVDALGDNLKVTTGLTGNSITAVDVVEAGTTPTQAELDQQAANDALAQQLSKEAVLGVDSEMFITDTAATSANGGVTVYDVAERAGTVTVTATLTFKSDADTATDELAADGQVDLTGMTIALDQYLAA